MASNFQVTYTGVESVQELIRSLPEKMTSALRGEVTTSVFNIQREVSGNFGGPIKVRSGNLRRSIQVEVAGVALGDTSGSIFSDMVYAPIQELGGVIEAKTAFRKLPGGPFLGIPVADNLTPSGLMRKSASTVMSEGGHFAKSHSGKWIIFSRSGGLMFVLVKSVTLKPRLGMVKAAENEVPKFLSRMDLRIQDEIL